MERFEHLTGTVQFDMGVKVGKFLYSKIMIIIPLLNPNLLSHLFYPFKLSKFWKYYAKPIRTIN